MSAALLLASPRNVWIYLSLSSTNLSASSKCSRGDKSALTLSSTYICNRRSPSSHLFFSFVVRVQKCQICHIIWTRWWQILVEMRFMKSIQFRWKASWSMLWLIFFLFKSTNIQLNLASAVVSSQGGEFLMAAEPQQLQMWNPTTNFAPWLS